MITIRPAAQRGFADHGWLKSRHTFSFAEYYHPEHMGFRGLRVINEDRVAPGKGFGTHSHRDMEIISYVLDGALQHKDSLGTGSVIRPGDVQRMSAGTGVSHSEFNGSSSQPVHFLQIWIIPRARGLQPGYEQKAFPQEAKNGKLLLVASPDGHDGSLTLNADARLYAGILGPGHSAELPLPAGRHAWVQVVSGELQLGDRTLTSGDGAALSDEPAVHLRGTTGGEVLVFDLA